MKRIVVNLLFLATVSAFATTSFAEEATIAPTNKSQKPGETPAPPEPQQLFDVSGTFDITSNYMFRGISQTKNKPAFQGGLTVSNPFTGIYFNVWGSNVDFFDPNGNQATVEFDTMIGITNNIGENFTYDININRYNYLDAGASNYNELITNLTYYFLTAQIGYSNDVYHVGRTGVYYGLNVAFEVPRLENVEISGGMGHYDLPKDKGLPSYNDYNVRLAKTFGIYEIAAQWTDTNHKSSDADNLKNSKILGTITASF